MLKLLPLVFIVLLMWLLFIRPLSKRQKELRGLQSTLTVGDEIVLTSGVYGTVREIEGDTVLVEIAAGVSIKVARGAVGTIATKVEQPTLPGPDEQPDTVIDGPEEN